MARAMAIRKLSPGKMLLPIVLLDGEKMFCAEAAFGAGVEVAPIWTRAMGLGVGIGPAYAGRAVVACETTRRGDRDGFAFGAAGEASVFEHLFEGDPNAKVFAYAIPVSVG